MNLFQGVADRYGRWTDGLGVESLLNPAIWNSLQTAVTTLQDYLRPDATAGILRAPGPLGGHILSLRSAYARVTGDQLMSREIALASGSCTQYFAPVELFPTDRAAGVADVPRLATVTYENDTGRVFRAQALRHATVGTLLGAPEALDDSDLWVAFTDALTATGTVGTTASDVYHATILFAGVPVLATLGLPVDALTPPAPDPSNPPPAPAPGAAKDLGLLVADGQLDGRYWQVWSNGTIRLLNADGSWEIVKSLPIGTVTGKRPDTGLAIPTWMGGR